MNNKLKNAIKIFVLTLAISAFIIFAYYGFFPFNTRQLMEIHYIVKDGIHLAFNINNSEDEIGNKYYCSARLKSLREESKTSSYELIKLITEAKTELSIIEVEIRDSPAYMAINNSLYRDNLSLFDIQRLEKLYKSKKELERYIKDREKEKQEIFKNYLAHCKKL